MNNNLSIAFSAIIVLLTLEGKIETMSDYEQFIEGIKRKTGIDLALYKEAQMKRRLNISI